MMNLRRRIDAIKKPFAKGEKWERFAPGTTPMMHYSLCQVSKARSGP